MQRKQHGNNLIQLTYYGFVNVYLVREEDGFTLVDTALKSCASSMVQVAQQCGLPIRRILLAHAHADHSGGLDAVSALVPDAEFVMPARDARFLTGDMSLDADEPRDKLRGWVMRKTSPTRLLHEGDQVGSLEVIATPGHTPGHCSFLDVRDRTLIAGDAFQTMGGVAVSGTYKPLFPLVYYATWHKGLALSSAYCLACPGTRPQGSRPRTPSQEALGRDGPRYHRAGPRPGASGKGAGDPQQNGKRVLRMVKQVNLALALVLELGVLVALAYWGFAIGATIPVKLVLGIGASAVAILVWAIWGAPRSEHRLRGIAYWLLRVVFDAVGAIALYMSGQQLLGTIFALIAALNCTLGYAWKQ